MSSTSAQPRSTKTQGECVVCGKICSTKCAACAGQGLEWMYFCSKTHQELIWFAHKRVCGLNSNPFQWPLLEDRELEECRDVKDFVFRDDVSGTAGSTWEKRSREQGRDLELSNRLAERPLDWLAYDLTSGLWPEYLDIIKENRHFEWWTELNHRLLIFYALVCRNYKSQEVLVEEIYKPIQFALFQVDEILKLRVSRDFPVEAGNLRKVFDTLKIKLSIDPRSGSFLHLWAFGDGQRPERLWDTFTTR
ncbi:hypothetical protein JCM5350_006848 [Sporobolomyces pararoseus]